MVDKSAVGATGEPFDIVIERGKIREFARATKSDHPEYLEAAEPMSPPTFLMTSAFWAHPAASTHGKVKMDLRRVLHGEQEFTFHGPPPPAGTTLTGQMRVADIYEKEGKRGGTMTFVVTVTEYRDASGRLVAEAKSTGIETGKAPEKG